MLNKCIDNAAFTVKVNNDILVYKGHGEGDTKWKGWSWKLLLIVLVIYVNNKKIQFKTLIQKPLRRIERLS